MEPESVRLLKWVYLSAFVFIGALVGVLFFFDNTLFEALRFDRLVDSYKYTNLAITIFQVTISFYLLLILIDAVSLFNYKKVFLRDISTAASILGFLIAGVAIVFFVVSLTKAPVHQTTPFMLTLVYLVIAVGLFLLDLLTFFVQEDSVLALPEKSSKKKSKN